MQTRSCAYNCFDSLILDNVLSNLICALFYFQLIVLFSSIYIKYYTSKRDSEWSTTLSAIISLSITLMTTALIPVDVFLVSFMKHSNGTFKVRS